MAFVIAQTIKVFVIVVLEQAEVPVQRLVSEQNICRALLKLQLLYIYTEVAILFGLLIFSTMLEH